ncbi:SBBP repeat-containing protein [Hymenobacter volaticus]|uniref:Uncharacterized protein n=1 Tax=Hymenobacter volaticus TaxID=2932254 RepID=A0ABY4GF03_9BACT|nr:SBBP repeat-containing protein [Hymenobacter volaticus]UOQ69094.1 hypothetical protein MUN86_26720 [Hymenobacter volaticus]
MNTSRDYTTVKYSPTGQQQWVARYNGPGNSSDQAREVALDGAGNVLVTGNVSVTVPGGVSGSATVKYSASGQQLWAAFYAGARRTR